MRIGNNWIGILIMIAGFAMIVWYPGLKYWYFGAALLALFFIWLAYQTFIKR